VSARVGRMEKQLMAEQSGESPDHSRMMRVAIKILEVDRSNFEKN
jgi:hypothetical protein